MAKVRPTRGKSRTFKPAKGVVVETESPKEESSPSDKDFLGDMRDKYQRCCQADEFNREKAIDDMKFVYSPGNQWDTTVLAQRGINRQSYTFNKLRITIKRVVNDMRDNRPSGKVLGNEDGDKDRAEIYEGLIRNIWNASDGDSVIDSAAEYQVGGGMGAWRVETELPQDEVDNQIIKISGFRNPFCVYADPHCQDPMKRDASYWFVTTMMSDEAFKAKYPGKDPVSYDDVAFDNHEIWVTEDSVRVCEYWYKKPVERQLWKLSDGRIIDQADYDAATFANIQASGQITGGRKASGFEIWMCIASGVELLAPPTKWAGRQFPFVIIYGEHVVIDGRTEWYGLTRWSKDSQKAYNMERTSMIEAIATASRAQTWATPAQAAGLQISWAEAHKQNLPTQFYNPDPKAPGPPVRMGGPEIPAALIQAVGFSSDDIKATSGIFDNSLGQQANESSGIAIRSRAAQGEIATFNYKDNLAKGVQRTWEICVDLIPKIYDAERTVRVLGQDGAEKFARINAQQTTPLGAVVLDPLTGKPVLINDLTAGRYDVTVTTGPSFSTQRQEAAETYTAMVQANPALFPLVGDLIFKATDLPYADQISERMKKMLPPQLQEQPGADGKPLPPEATQAIQQAQAAMEQVQAATNELQQHAQALDDGKAELQQQINALDVKKAELDATYKGYLAQIAQKEAALAVSQAELVAAQATATADVNSQSIENDRAALSAEVQNAMSQVQQMAGQFMQQVGQHMAMIQTTLQPNVTVTTPAKRRMISVKRVNGELHGEVLDVPNEPVPQGVTVPSVQ